MLALSIESFIVHRILTFIMLIDIIHIECYTVYKHCLNIDLEVSYVHSKMQKLRKRL